MFAATTFPLIPLILIILAGITLRYAIWYGDGRKSQTRAESFEDNILSKQLSEQEAIVGDLTVQLEDLQTSSSQLSEQRDALMKQCDDLNNQLESTASVNSSLTSELADLASVNDELDRSKAELRDQLEETHKSNRELRANVTALEKTIQKLGEDSQELDNLRKQNELLQADGELQQREIESLSQERKDVAAKLAQSSSQLEQSHARLLAKTKELDEARLSFEGIDQTSRTLRGDLARDRNHILDLEEQLERVAGDSTQAQSKVNEQKQHLEEMESMLNYETRRANDLETSLQQTATSFAKKDSEAIRLTEDLTAAVNKIDAHEETIKQLHDSIDQLQSTHAKQTAELLGQQQLFQDRVQGLEHEIEGGKQQWMNLASTKQTEIDRLDGANENLQASIGRLQDQIGQRDACLRAIRIEKEETLTRLEQERNERALLEKTLGEYRDTLENISFNSTSFESLLETQTALQDSLQEQAQRLQEISANEQPAARSRSSESSADVVFPPANNLLQRENSQKNSQTGEELVLDEGFGWVYTSPPAKSDNLKWILGIGEILEEQLNALGIYTFSQINQWTPEMVNQVSKKLAFRDRIEREDWVTQASRLDGRQENQAA